MTDLNLEELERICNAVKWDELSDDTFRHMMPETEEFVLASRTALPQLIAEVRRLRDNDMRQCPNCNTCITHLRRDLGAAKANLSHAEARAERAEAVLKRLKKAKPGGVYFQKWESEIDEALQATKESTCES